MSLQRNQGRCCESGKERCLSAYGITFYAGDPPAEDTLWRAGIEAADEHQAIEILLEYAAAGALPAGTITVQEIALHEAFPFPPERPGLVAVVRMEKRAV